MAQYDKVTYQFYTDVLNRHAVPDEATFDEHKLQNLAYVQALVSDGLLIERMPNGIASACCMMIEEDYKAAEIAAGNGSVDTSESIGGYSHSMNTKAYDIQQEKDATSTAAKKNKWLHVFCYVMNGVR